MTVFRESIGSQSNSSLPPFDVATFLGVNTDPNMGSIQLELPLSGELISIEELHCQHCLVLECQDMGPGLSKENLQQLFGEGVQFNPNQLQAGQGSGLGLWITKGLVGLHHGTIQAASEGLGKGATFTLKLPLVEVKHYGDNNSSARSKPQHSISARLQKSLVATVNSSPRWTPRNNINQTNKNSSEKQLHPHTAANSTPPSAKHRSLRRSDLNNENNTFNRVVASPTASLQHQASSRSSTYSASKAPKKGKFTHQKSGSSTSSGNSRSVSAGFSNLSGRFSKNSNSYRLSMSSEVVVGRGELSPDTRMNSEASMIVPIDKEMNEFDNEFLLMGSTNISDTNSNARDRGTTFASRISATTSGNNETTNNFKYLQSGNDSLYVVGSGVVSPVCDNNAAYMEEMQQAKIAGSLRIETVLVVDDAPTNRKVLCRILKIAGYTCLQAIDGRDAINTIESEFASTIGVDAGNIDERAAGIASGLVIPFPQLLGDKKSPVHLILMDSEMPIMKGPEATFELRQRGYSDIMIIGITGNVLPEDIRYFLDHGADAVLAKPLSLDRLAATVERITTERIKMATMAQLAQNEHKDDDINA